MSNHYIISESNRYFEQETSDTFSRPSSHKDYVEQACTCKECGQATIVEYNLRTHAIATYELGPYSEQRINHRHPADNFTKASIVSAIIVEKRCSFERRVEGYDHVSWRVMD